MVTARPRPGCISPATASPGPSIRRGPRCRSDACLSRSGLTASFLQSPLPDVGGAANRPAAWMCLAISRTPATQNEECHEPAGDTAYLVGTFRRRRLLRRRTARRWRNRGIAPHYHCRHGVDRSTLTRRRTTVDGLILPGEPPLSAVDDPAVEQMNVTLHLRLPAGIMRDDADSGPARVELVEHLHQRFAALRVEVARRLVGEQDGRPACDRARDSDELLLAA